MKSLLLNQPGSEKRRPSCRRSPWLFGWLPGGQRMANQQMMLFQFICILYIYIYPMYVYIYIYDAIPINMYIYIYIYIHAYHVHVYIYIYIMFQYIRARWHSIYIFPRISNINLIDNTEKHVWGWCDSLYLMVQPPHLSLQVKKNLGETEK